MKMSVMVVLVKHDGLLGTKDIMDELCQYHLSNKAKKQRTVSPALSRDIMIKSLPSEIHEFSDSNQRIMYFGLTGKELERALGIQLWNKPEPTPRPDPGINTSGPMGGD